MDFIDFFFQTDVMLINVLTEWIKSQLHCSTQPYGNDFDRFNPLTHYQQQLPVLTYNLPLAWDYSAILLNHCELARWCEYNNFITDQHHKSVSCLVTHGDFPSITYVFSGSHTMKALHCDATITEGTTSVQKVKDDKANKRKRRLEECECERWHTLCTFNAKLINISPSP